MSTATATPATNANPATGGGVWLPDGTFSTDKRRCRSAEFRAAFVHVWAAKKQNPNPDGSPRPDKYQLTMLFPKQGGDMKALQLAAAAAMTAKFGDRASWPKGYNNPFKDGDSKDYDGFAGHWYIDCSSGSKPGLVDIRNQPIMDSEGIYGGCYCRASLAASYFEILDPTTKAVLKRGVKFYLNNLQKVREGTPFRSQRSASDDFADAPGTLPPAPGTAAADFGQDVRRMAAGSPAAQAPAGEGMGMGVAAGASDEPPF